MIDYKLLKKIDFLDVEVGEKFHVFEEDFHGLKGPLTYTICPKSIWCSKYAKENLIKNKYIESLKKLNK